MQGAALTGQTEGDNKPPTLSYYVSSWRVRRELIPFFEEGEHAGYRCLTYRADNGPIDNVDTVVADQVEFDNVLIKLKLKHERNPAEGAMAWGWRVLHMDKAFPSTRPKEGEPLETLLRFVN